LYNKNYYALQAGLCRRFDLDNDKIAEALQKVSADEHPSEFHGIMCGLLCASGTEGAAHWMAQTARVHDPADILAKEAREELIHLLQETAQQMTAPECDFQPLLPSDDSMMEVRIQALSEWCQGFLVGLSYGGIKDLENLPEDCAEIARDFSEIAKAESYAFEESEADEVAYTDLVEYIHTAVLLFFEELNPVNSTSQNKNESIH
jgi:uncharacterized protein YgfB (UPF0149 family)